jgi:hypothetical protein
MKTLLTLLLLIPSLSWGSEEKARELYVKAEVEFNQSGCSISEFKRKISDAKLINIKLLNLSELSDVNSIKKGLIGWFVVYGLGGWLLDFNKYYNDNSLLTSFLLLTGLSIFMAFVTWKS